MRLHDTTMETHDHPASHREPPKTAPTGATAKDPVCGMTVDLARAKHQLEHDGRTIAFCSAGCLAKFRAEPSKFEHGAQAATPRARSAASDDAEYTCPMHPQIVQKGPGACPICGMALEPKRVTADASPAESAELEDMQQRLVGSAVFTVPLFLVAMADMLPGDPVGHAVGMMRLPWIELALAAPVVLWGGLPFFARAVQSVRRGALNMFTLIGVGTGAAFLYSLVATLAPGLFPPAMRGHRGTVDVYSRPRR